MSKDFKKIARKIKRRRIIVSAIIILVTLMATTSVLNYKVSQGNEEPFIALGTNYEFGDETTIKITTSIGFKHIKYESRYGKNYSECVPFWKSYDKNPVSISADQYEKIRAYIEKSIYGGKGVAGDYFDVFRTYEADVIDVIKTGDKVEVYMLGDFYNFIEYDGTVYGIGSTISEDATGIGSIYDEEPIKTPVKVTVDVSNNGFKIEAVKYYGTGYGGSSAIWNDFSKGAAMKALTQADDGNKKDASYRAQIAAAAYFGKSLDFDKRIHFEVETQEIQVYQIVDASDVSENEDENDVLIKTAKLAPRE